MLHRRQAATPVAAITVHKEGGDERGGRYRTQAGGGLGGRYRKHRICFGCPGASFRFFLVPIMGAACLVTDYKVYNYKVNDATYRTHTHQKKPPGLIRFVVVAAVLQLCPTPYG